MFYKPAYETMVICLLGRFALFILLLIDVLELNKLLSFLHSKPLVQEGIDDQVRILFLHRKSSFLLVYDCFDFFGEKTPSFETAPYDAKPDARQASYLIINNYKHNKYNTIQRMVFLYFVVNKHGYDNNAEYKKTASYLRSDTARHHR
jgi:hypothetical protein